MTRLEKERCSENSLSFEANNKWWKVTQVLKSISGAWGSNMLRLCYVTMFDRSMKSFKH